MEQIYGYYLDDLAKVLIAAGVVGLTGLVGNMLSIIVWTRPQMKSSTSLLMTALAVADMVVIVCLLVLNSWPIFRYFIPNSTMLLYFWHIIYSYVLFWLMPISFIAQMASMHLTLAITVERYIAVCYPFEYRIVWSYKRSCLFAAVMVTLAILFNLIRFWEWEIYVAETDVSGNVVRYNFRSTMLRSSSLYVSLYHGWLSLLFRFLLPLAGIIGFNTAVHQELKKAKEAREPMTDIRESDDWISVMLFYIVGEFLVCSSINLFYYSFVCLELQNYDFGFDTDRLVIVNYFITIFNSSINFVTYITFSRPFRRMFLRTICCRGGDPQPRLPTSQKK